MRLEFVAALAWRLTFLRARYTARAKGCNEKDWGLERKRRPHLRTAPVIKLKCHRSRERGLPA